MGYPANVSTVTVTGSWTTSDGSTTKPTGTVTFTPNARLQDGPTGQIIDQKPLVATLVNGAISVTLMATDDPDLSPSGWAYVVTENIAGQPAITYVLQFPAAQTPVDLSTKAPLVAVPGLVGYVALAAVGAPAGVASLDGAGNVPLAQLGNATGGSVPSGTVMSGTTFGQAAAAGAATTYSRGDHTHGTPALGTTGATAAAGNDSRILGAVQASLATTKGDLLAATGASVLARVGVGADGQVLKADAAQAAGIKWAPGGMDQVYPLAGYGLLAASVDPSSDMGTSTLGNNTIFASRVWIPAGVAITNLWIAIRDAGTWDGATGPNQLGLYTDAGVKVDNTADAATIWTTNGWRGGALAGGQVAAQAAGRFVYLLPLHRGMTAAPNVPFVSSANDAHNAWFNGQVGGGTKRRCTILTGQTSLPASFDPTASGTATTFVPLVAVS
jgi:hypothetical protein